NIGGNGRGGAPHLDRQAESFFRRKRAAPLVDGQRDGKALLPHLKVFVASGSHGRLLSHPGSVKMRPFLDAKSDWLSDSLFAPSPAGGEGWGGTSLPGFG